MSIEKCISCEYVVIQENYDRITKSVIACKQHHDIFAPECEYRQKEGDTMSDDLISREKTTKWLQEWLMRTASATDGYRCTASSLVEYIAKKNLPIWMASMPSAEPQRKKGKWILSADRGYARCSECNDRVYFLYNFCPSCGAEMRR